MSLPSVTEDPFSAKPQACIEVPKELSDVELFREYCLPMCDMDLWHDAFGLDLVYIRRTLYM